MREAATQKLQVNPLQHKGKSTNIKLWSSSYVCLQPLEALDQEVLAKTSSFIQQLEEEKQLMLAAVLLEYSTGGNVRLEAVHPESTLLSSVIASITLQVRNATARCRCILPLPR